MLAVRPDNCTRLVRTTGSNRVYNVALPTPAIVIANVQGQRLPSPLGGLRPLPTVTTCCASLRGLRNLVCDGPVLNRLEELNGSPPSSLT